ncbi:hypothetical protein WOLCODRAFT_147101, partial [Wolfiporia cocos MD-104 SS10]
MTAAAAPLAPTAAPALDKVSLPNLSQTAAPGDDLKPTLPTLDRLGASLQPDVDVQKVASEFFRTFAQHVSANNVEGITSLFLEDGWWRDQLALTWEFRTFHGVGKIRKFLADQLAGSGIALGGVRDVALQQPYPDLA